MFLLVHQRGNSGLSLKDIRDIKCLCTSRGLKSVPNAPPSCRNKPSDMKRHQVCTSPDWWKVKHPQKRDGSSSTFNPRGKGKMAASVSELQSCPVTLSRFSVEHGQTQRSGMWSSLPGLKAETSLFVTIEASHG